MTCKTKEHQVAESDNGYSVTNIQIVQKKLLDDFT